MDEVLLTLRAATLATLLAFPVSLGIAWLLARKRWPGKLLVETLIALPLVLPPVATGLLLLKLFSRRSPVGSALHEIGWDVIFTWRGVIVAMTVMSAPFLIRAARVAFEGVNPRYEQIARTLGASPSRTFFTITLPLASRGIIAGTVLAFARAVGEFGATILVAGNIPGRTRTLATSIYDNVQLGYDEQALRLVMVALVIAFTAIWISELLTRRSAR
jgi:molybdate transport system permease protein